MHLLNAIGLRPEAFPPGSPLAPLGSLLEFVYAGLRRIDHRLFNEAPTTTTLVNGVDPYTGAQLGTDPTTGVITGRVAYDPDDLLQFAPTVSPTHGTVVFEPDGTFTYSPNLSEVHPVGESDSFTVDVSEVTGPHTAIATVNFTVAAHDTVIDTIAVGASPVGLAVTPDGSRVYVVNSADGTVSVIDTASNTISVLPIAVGGAPSDIAISPDGRRVYVVNHGDSTVSIVDGDPTSATFNTVLATSAILGPDPHIDAFNSLQVEDVAVNPSDGTVWVTTYNSFSPLNNVWVINPDTGVVLHSFRADGDLADPGDAVLGDIEFDAARSYAYLADQRAKGPRRRYDDQHGGQGGDWAWPDPSGDDPEYRWQHSLREPQHRRHHIGDRRQRSAQPGRRDHRRRYKSGPVRRTRCRWRPRLCQQLHRGAEQPRGGTVSVIQLSDNSFVRNIPVGAFPADVTVSPDGTRVYVTNRGDDTVSVIAVLLDPR